MSAAVSEVVAGSPQPLIIADGDRTYGPRAKVNPYRLAVAYFGETRANFADFWRYMDQLDALLRPHDYVVNVQREGDAIYLESPDTLFRYRLSGGGGHFSPRAGYWLLPNQEAV